MSCGSKLATSWNERAQSLTCDALVNSHGTDMLLLERREFLRILHDGMPDKSHIRTGSSIKKIVHAQDRVEVTLFDGSVEVGDIVMGCDGVYSTVRSLMWEHAAHVTPGLITAKEKTSEFAAYCTTRRVTEAWN